jgi:hypothetical protein
MNSVNDNLGTAGHMSREWHNYKLIEILVRMLEEMNKAKQQLLHCEGVNKYTWN